MNNMFLPGFTILEGTFPVGQSGDYNTGSGEDYTGNTMYNSLMNVWGFYLSGEQLAQEGLETEGWYYMDETTGVWVAFLPTDEGWGAPPPEEP